MSGLERFHDLFRAISALGRKDLDPIILTLTDNTLINQGVVRMAIGDATRWHAVHNGCRHQFPIGEMATNQNCWLAGPDQLIKDLGTNDFNLFAARGQIEQVCVGKLTGEPPEIIPHADQQIINLALMGFGKDDLHIGAGDMMGRGEGTECLQKTQNRPGCAIGRNGPPSRPTRSARQVAGNDANSIRLESAA